MNKGKSISHIKDLLNRYDQLTDLDRRVQWIPQKPILERLLDPDLTPVDRCEIVMVAYAEDHGGNSPSSYEAGKALGLSHCTIYIYVTKLIKQNRAQRIHGELVLRDSKFSHPLLSKTG